MKYIGILLGLLLWPAACMAPPTYGPYPTATGGGSGSATNVFFIAGQSTTPRTIGGSNAVDVVGTLTNSTTGNAASATWATNVHNVDSLFAGTINTNVIFVSRFLGGATNTTFYRRNHLHYTNGSGSGLIWWDGAAVSESGLPTVTNAAHSDPSSDFAAVASGSIAPWNTFQALFPGGWEDLFAPLTAMRSKWWQSSNSVSAGFVSAYHWSPYQLANFGTNASTIVDGFGIAPNGNGIKVSIPENSDSYKIGVAVINPFPKLTEMYIENQSAGSRLGSLVWGVNWTGESFFGSPGLFRIINTETAEPHDDLLTVNRTNGQTTIFGALQLTNKTSNLKATITMGNGSPESVVTANAGSLFLRTDGGASTTLYVKTSGTGNTGWTAK